MMFRSGAAMQGRALSKDPVEIWTTQLEGEPAVQAWRRLEARHATPARVELLRRRAKSVVYRLPGVGRNGSDVIAKQCFWQIALDERAVYEVLRDLPEPQLTYYGLIAEPDGELAWLFVEDARGDPWDPADAEQRRLAARWLAGLHTASSHAPIAARLPDRGPAYFREHLASACRRIRDGFENPALTPEGRPVLHRMLALFDAIERRWSDIEAACEAMPRALVHGDFAERNVRVRREGASLALVAFDWEVAGWGLPGVDLRDVDLAAYRADVRARWPELDPPASERLVAMGDLLRGGIAAAHWASESLATTWVEGAVGNLAIYHERMLQALDALGWPQPVAAP